jgi:MoaA/NifB/PqqE/SkfB family radical SAM enzyme
MIRGEKPQECEACWHLEQSDSTSLRKQFLKKYANEFDSWLDDPQVRELAWSPSSLCNFTCRICDESSSSSIAVEEIRFATTPQHRSTLQAELGKRSNPQVNWSAVQDVLSLPHLTYLHLLGGEPFIWPGLRPLLDALVSHGRACNIRLSLNTNGSWYPQDIIEFMITHFQALDLNLSVDSTCEQFELERGGSWHNVINNLTQFARLQLRGVNVKLAVTINLQNVLYLDRVIDLANELGLELIWTYLEEPKYLNIDYATDRAREAIVAKYSNHSECELRSLAQRVKQSPGSDGHEFVAYMDRLDARRGQQFATSHREIYEAMGGCTIPDTNI